MTSPFLASLDAEISRLETVLEAFPEMRQLKELRRVRSLYAGQQSAIPTPSADGFQRTAIPPRPGRKMSSERQQAIEFALVHMTGQTQPTKTVDLLEALRANGIEIGGNDPVNSLSALLSTSSRFVAHGRSGWTLKPESNGSHILPVSDEPNADAPPKGKLDPSSSSLWQRRLPGSQTRS